MENLLYMANCKGGCDVFLRRVWRMFCVHMKLRSYAACSRAITGK